MSRKIEGGKEVIGITTSEHRRYIPVQGLNRVNELLALYIYGEVSTGMEDRGNQDLVDAYGSNAGTLAGRFINIRRSTRAQEFKELVDDIAREIEARGAFYKHFDYEGMGTNLFKTAIDVINPYKRLERSIKELKSPNEYWKPEERASAPRDIAQLEYELTTQPQDGYLLGFYASYVGDEVEEAFASSLGIKRNLVSATHTVHFSPRGEGFTVDFDDLSDQVRRMRLKLGFNPGTETATDIIDAFVKGHLKFGDYHGFAISAYLSNFEVEDPTSSKNSPLAVLGQEGRDVTLKRKTRPDGIYEGVPELRIDISRDRKVNPSHRIPHDSYLITASGVDLVSDDVRKSLEGLYPEGSRDEAVAPRIAEIAKSEIEELLKLRAQEIHRRLSDITANTSGIQITTSNDAVIAHITATRVPKKDQVTDGTSFQIVKRQLNTGRDRTDSRWNTRQIGFVVTEDGISEVEEVYKREEYNNTRSATYNDLIEIYDSLTGNGDEKYFTGEQLSAASVELYSRVSEMVNGSTNDVVEVSTGKDEDQSDSTPSPVISHTIYHLFNKIGEGVESKGVQIFQQDSRKRDMWVPEWGVLAGADYRVRVINIFENGDLNLTQYFRYIGRRGERHTDINVDLPLAKDDLDHLSGQLQLVNRKIMSSDFYWNIP